MHGLPPELLDSAIKAFVGALTTLAVSALFKKLNLRVRLFFAKGIREVCSLKKNPTVFAFCGLSSTVKYNRWHG